MKAPSIAIASYISSRDGAVSSSEILQRFGVGHSTLKRRRPELRRLGIVFVEDGNRSFYATRQLIKDFPPSTNQVPTKRRSPDENGRHPVVGSERDDQRNLRRKSRA
jgi:hypothetical protein